MFKTLTRTLKLGLTTLTILTAGAGAAFAQPAGFDTAIDPIAECSNGGGFRTPSYCTPQVVSCIRSPFGANCATTLGTKAHTVAKVRYCRDQEQGRFIVTAYPCSDTWSGVNAAMWAKQNPDAPDSPDTDNIRNQFLKGTADGLDTGDFIVHSDRYKGALYFNAAKFNKKALGGDVTDGVAFFVSNNGRFYSGILSGTDLGAPVDNPAGTSASWVGRFQSVWWNANQNFVLEITFGHADSDKDGSIEAFVRRNSRNQYYTRASHFHLKGYFNNSGLITKGTVDLGNFMDNDRDRPTGDRYPGVLTGLIGQDGVVGAFHSNTSYYSGGFVARPANLVQGLAPNFIADTCTGPNGDPFHKFCHVANVGKVLMDEKRNLRVTKCIQDDNASNDALCENAIDRNPCILNPFAKICAEESGEFATYYEAARANRIAFCNDPTNSENTLCAGDAVANICGYDPFHAVCFAVDNPDDDPNNNIYATNRTDKINFCGVRANKDDASCKGTRARVTSANLLQSFTEELSSVPSTTNRRHQFLKDLEDKSAGNIDIGDTVGDIVLDRSGSLNLSTAEFNGEYLDGDATNGVAFFLGRVNGQSTHYHYSGIFSGTDLGAPVTQMSGTASWVGKFQAISWTTNEEFVLEIDFDGTDDKTGLIKAFVQEGLYGRYHFYLDGYYDDHGVITGTVDFGAFTNKDREGSTRPPNGTLTGLIGKDGAVGVFHGNRRTIGSFSGGFVARPPTTQGRNNETTFLHNICTTDPFHQFCHVDYETERSTRIEECINATGSANNYTRCANAIVRNPCILNPFAEICAAANGEFATYYEDARANRAIFCHVKNNAKNRLCTTGDLSEKICIYDPFTAICLTGTTHKAARETRFDLCNNAKGDVRDLRCKDAAATRICDYDPFNKICFGQGNIYETARVAKITTCQDKLSDSSCYGAKQNPNSVAWASSFVTTQEPNGLLSSADPENKRHQFLKGGATELSHAGFINEDDDDESNVLRGSLNLATATFDDNKLGGDESDGVAFFRGTHSDGARHYYAGILSGTNLGGPLTETTVNVDWYGSLQYVGPRSAPPSAVDFTLTVNFNAGNKAGRINSDDVVLPNIGTWTLDGTFNDKGIITGDVFKGITNIGIITGLIGQQGAVGAFRGDERFNTNFSGGFVARPFVKVANLSPLPTLPRDLTSSGFLTASKTGLLTDSVSLPQGHTLHGQQMILRRGGADSNNPDGIAYFYTINDNGNTSFSYGGILATTNLGAPVEATQASAIWEGHHSYRNSLIENEKTDFYVNFAEGKFGFLNDGRNGIGSVLMTTFANNPEVTFTLNGLFGSQNNMAVGRLGGTLDYVFTGGNTNADADDDGIVRYKFDVHGLIGKEGAVGVYLEEGVNASRVGGFVASAPTQ